MVSFSRVAKRYPGGQAALPAGHPAAGKGLVRGKPAAYVCRGQTCSLPITEPEALGKVLQF